MRKDTLHRKLSQARWRWAIHLFLGHLGVLGVVLGGVGVGVVCSLRLFAIPLLNVTGAIVLGMASLVGVVVWWGFKFPTLTQAALLLDERFNLKERCVTLLTLAQRQDPFVDNAYQEALPHLEQVVPKERIRIAPGRQWRGVLLVWLMVGGLYGFLPQQDWLGRLREQQQQDRQQNQQAQVQADIRNTASVIKAQAQQLDRAGLEEDLAELNAALQQADPNQARRHAIRAMGDMSQKLQQKSNQDRQALDQLKQVLRQLKGTPQALSQQLSMALAQGKFSQAAALTRQLQQQLNQGQLSPDQRRQLEQQLQDLARQLDQLTQQRQERLGEELAQMGLNPELAQMSPDKARQAMQQAGLSASQIEKMLEKMAANQSAMASASQLAQAMGAASGGGGGDLSQMIEALDQMDAFAQQGAMSAAMLAQLRQSINAMGQYMGQGQGMAMGMVTPSDMEQEGIGLGIASGFNVPEDEPVTYQKTQSQSKTQDGPVVASWYFQGQNVKGQAQRALQQVATEAAQQAAEAVEDHRIPKKYEAAVKGYFGQLQQGHDTEDTSASEPSSNP